jgi:hypothetical protein
MRIYLDVCDVCHDPGRLAKIYTVSVDDRSGETCRCEEHGSELEFIISQAESESKEEESAPVRPTRAARGRPLKVTTIEAFEAEKKTTKSPPARKARGSRAR